MIPRLFCFAPAGGNYGVHHQLDLALALGVKIRGGAVAILGCRGSYVRCEAVMNSPQDRQSLDCQYCAANGRALFSIGEPPFFAIDELVTPEEIAEADRWSAEQLPMNYEEAIYRGSPLGRWILSSVLTAYQISSAELHRAELLDFYRATLRNAALTAQAVERVIEHFKPTVATVFNGRFAQYRTAYELLRRAGVRVLTHERGFSDNTFLFFDNAPINDVGEMRRIAEPWQHVPLRTPELQRVKAYLSSREAGRDFNAPAVVQYTSDERTVRVRLGVGDSSLIGFFTSTETELSQAEQVVLANTQLPLLKKAIESMRGLPDCTLVIRHHPNLIGDEHHRPEYDFISQFYNVLCGAPSNVRCVMPSEKLSTYAILWHLDAAIAPVSSVGIELPARGVASLTNSAICYALAQHSGFSSWETADLSSLIPALRQQSRVFDVDDLRRAYRFIYSYIERASFPFRSIKIKDFYRPEILPTIFEDLGQGTDPHFNRILDGITRGSPIYSSPSAEELARSVAEEDAFLRLEIESVRTKRRELFEQSLAEQLSPEWKSLGVIEFTPRQSRYPVFIASRDQSLSIAQFKRDLLEKSFFRTLRILVESGDSEFVMFAHPSGSFDGHFIWEGFETFREHGGACDAVIRGAWLADSTGKIFAEILSRRVSASTAEAIESAFGGHIDPLLVLSLGFYRRSAAAALLRELETCESPGQAARVVVRSWQSTRFVLRLGHAGIFLLNR